MKFTSGETVIYIGGDPNQDPRCINPPFETKVTISLYHHSLKGYQLVEYPFHTGGLPQYFHEFELKKIDDGFAESILKQLANEPAEHI